MAPTALLAQLPAQMQTQPATYGSGIGLGSVIAVVCSWKRNHSILRAIVAGILSWIYVVYFVIPRKPDERK